MPAQKKPAKKPVQPRAKSTEEPAVYYVKLVLPSDVAAVQRLVQDARNHRVPLATFVQTRLLDLYTERLVGQPYAVQSTMTPSLPEGTKPTTGGAVADDDILASARDFLDDDD